MKKNKEKETVKEFNKCMPEMKKTIKDKSHGLLDVSITPKRGLHVYFKRRKRKKKREEG